MNPLSGLSLERLRQRTSVKWREYPDDVLPLWVAEMDVDPAEPIKRAIIDALELGDTGYPAGTEYPEALAAFANERWGWDGIAVERTALVSDVMLGIVELIKLVSGPGDPVIVSPPVYPPFYLFVRSMGRAVIEAPLTNGRLDLEVLERTFQHVKANPVYLLCNPQNPTGTVHTAEELTALAGLAKKYGVRVIADEIHAPVVSQSAKFVPYLSVDDQGMSLMSASKGWNLAAMRAAVAVANTDELARLPEEVSHGPSHFGTIAHTAALRHGGEWLDALLAGLDDNRKLLKNLLTEHLPEIGYEPSEATFLAWLDCRAISDDPAAFFVERARVALMSGTGFGSGAEGHVRLNIGTSPEILTEAVTRMAAAVRQ